jgi:hypothetical protein
VSCTEKIFPAAVSQLKVIWWLATRGFCAVSWSRSRAAYRRLAGETAGGEPHPAGQRLGGLVPELDSGRSAQQLQQEVSAVIGGFRERDFAGL